MGHRKASGRPLGGSRAGVKARGGQQQRLDQRAPGFGEDDESWSDKAAKRGQEEGRLQGEKGTSAVAGRSR